MWAAYARPVERDEDKSANVANGWICGRGRPQCSTIEKRRGSVPENILEELLWKICCCGRHGGVVAKAKEKFAQSPFLNPAERLFLKLSFRLMLLSVKSIEVAVRSICNLAENVNDSLPMREIRDRNRPRALPICMVDNHLSLTIVGE